jgi:L-serine dehydratase
MMKEKIQMLEYHSIEDLCRAAEQAQMKISELVLADQAEQMEIPAEEIYARMEKNLQVMRDAVREGMNPDLRSTSGLTGGDAAKMKAYAETGGMTGKFLNHAMAHAIAVSEYNAAMGKIVASPTAGSCGILPGTVVSMLEAGKCDEHAAVMSLITAGAIGMVIAEKASIAGAQGGCQAECGSASAMAAAALVELCGGTPSQAAHACAMAIKNQLGLVCDPVAGLVEIPCIKRNVSGIAIAFTSAEMAMAGIESKIPVDECISAMRQVGDMLPCALKETAQGGLASTPTGIRLKKQVFGEA